MTYETLILTLIPLFLVLILFEAIMKGIALWKCGRNKQLVWYVFIFILNTAGILPLIYLLFFRKKDKNIKKKAKKKK